MKMKKNEIIFTLLSTILLGLSTWVLISIVELQSIVSMMQQELMNLDKVIGRIYHHMDRLMNK